MKTTYIFALIIFTFLVSCKQNEEQNITSDPSTTTEKDHAAHGENMGWISEISLNNGSKWEANRETTRGVLNMKRLIDLQSPNSIEDYKSLGVDLTEEVNTLIKECTMKGPAHNNLHIYLEPLIIRIVQLREVVSEEEGTQLTSEIEQHLNAYKGYFV